MCVCVCIGRETAKERKKEKIYSVFSVLLIEVFECQLVVMVEYGLEVHFGKITAAYESVGTIYSIQASTSSNP